MLPTLPHLPLKPLLPQPLPPLLQLKVSSTKGKFPYSASRSAGGVFFVANLSNSDGGYDGECDSFFVKNIPLTKYGCILCVIVYKEFL